MRHPIFFKLLRTSKRLVSRGRMMIFCLGFVIAIVISELIFWGPQEGLLYLLPPVVCGILIAPTILFPATLAGLLWFMLAVLPLSGPVNSRDLDPQIKNNHGVVYKDLNQRSGGANTGPTNGPSGGLSTFTGVIERSPRYRKPGLVEIVVKTSNGRRLLCKGKDLPWRNTSKVNVNDHVRVRAHVKNIQPGYSLLSFERGLLRDGISAECRLEWIAFVKGVEGSRIGWLLGVGDRLREEIKRLVLTSNTSSEASHLFFALTLGERDLVSQETEKAFRLLGLSHLLVLSGYQISLIFCLVFWMISNLLGRFYPIFVSGPAVIATAMALAAALMLAIISGLEKPALRAIAAVITVQIIKLRGGSLGFMDQISINIFCLIVFSGVSIIDPSVDLTLAAVAGIMIGNTGSIIGRYLWSNWCATAATGLISLVWFKEWSWIALFVNPILAPILGIIPIFTFLILLILALISPKLLSLVIAPIMETIGTIRDELVTLAACLPPPASGGICILSSATICTGIVAVAIARRQNLRDLTKVNLKVKVC